jgi:hypothetical protein
LGVIILAKKKLKLSKGSHKLNAAFVFAVLGLMVFGFALKAVSGNTSSKYEGDVLAADEKGYDEFGYNRNARMFNSKADGIDKVMDGMVWGDATYANDKLVMKWNDEWDRGNAEGWSNPPYSAWESNEWNGRVKGGSGETWHYKIVWVGDYNEDPTLIPEGAYGVWGQFAVVMDRGQSPDSGPGAIWFAHATPGGYGAY